MSTLDYDARIAERPAQTQPARAVRPDRAHRTRHLLAGGLRRLADSIDGRRRPTTPVLG